MISIIEVYNAIRDLCNKDQKGFITPKIFNSFSEVSQEAIFAEMFREIPMAKKLRRANIDAAKSVSTYRGILDDLSGYIDESVLTTAGGSLSGDSNLYSKPIDISRIIGLRLNDDDRTPVELIYDLEKASHVLSSNLSAPTDSFPVALVSHNIEVFPSGVSGLIMTYYRHPASVFAVNTPDGFRGEVDRNSSPRIVGESFEDGFLAPDLAQCRNFELPEHYKGELIGEIAKLIGVRLRDPILGSFSQTETTAN